MMLAGPSAEFIKKFASKPNLLKSIERCQKEFAIYSYLVDRVPSELRDKDWARLLDTKRISDRVAFLNLLALTQSRHKEDALREKIAREKVVEHYKQQAEIYSKGGMGYGPFMHQLYLSPFAQTQELVEQHYDVRQYFAQKSNEQPTLAFDCQYLPTEMGSARSRMGDNLQAVISHNRTGLMHTFPLTLFNCDQKSEHVQNFLRHVRINSRTVAPDTFMPTVYENNPYLNNQDKEIIYFSRYAREMFDGPLKHDVYIVPVTFDAKKKSLSGARTGIHQMLGIVSDTGGDWHRALHAVVPKRRLLSHEENKEVQARAIYVQNAKFKQEEYLQAIKAIAETMGEYDCTNQ